MPDAPQNSAKEELLQSGLEAAAS